MKNSTTSKREQFCLNVVLAVLAVLAGLCLAGCDGSAGDDGGVVSPDNPCDALAATLVIVVDTIEHNKTVTPSEKATALCTGWSAKGAGGSVAECVSGLSVYMTESQARAECATSMTATQCGDVEHDYVDSAGVSHTFGVQGTQGGTWVLSTFGVLPSPCTSWSPICTAQGRYGVYLGKSCH